MNDPISDMIIRMKNATAIGKKVVAFPYSELKFNIATVLEREGYVKNVVKKGKKIGKAIELELVYDNNKPKLKDVKRVSKFSRRVYLKVKDIKPVKNGYGRLILSTPSGLLTDKEAKEKKVGGEALFKIW